MAARNLAQGPGGGIGGRMLCGQGVACAIAPGHKARRAHGRLAHRRPGCASAALFHFFSVYPGRPSELRLPVQARRCLQAAAAAAA